LFAVEAQIPSGVSLPAGMSPAEAQSIAIQNGVTIGADGKPQLPPGMTADQARGIAQQNGVKVGGGDPGASPKAPKSTPSGEVTGTDPHEGDVASGSDASDQESPEGRERRLRAGGGSMRWGQRFFQLGDASMAASHVGAIGPEYALGPGDELILTLWGQKEGRFSLELDRDGQVSLELVGVVSLNGQTLKSAEELLRKRLTRIYAGLADGTTQMDLTMGKLKQIRVYVVGDVVKPGSFLLSGNTSVLAALFQARGPNDLGTERLIEVRRGGGLQKIDLYDYLARGRKPARDMLQDGDLIRIPPKGAEVQIQGDVHRPGAYELLESEGVKELVGYAGGFRSTVSNQAIVAVRLFPGGRRDVVQLGTPSDLRQGKPAPLQDQDQVMVYAGNDPTQATIVLQGEVRFPGLYPWTPGLTIGKALGMAGGLSPAALSGMAYLKRGRFDGSVSLMRDTLDAQGHSARLVMPLDTIQILNRFAFVSGGQVSISGAVRNPQSVAYRTGMTLRDLVIQAGGFRKVEAPAGTIDTAASLLKSVADTAGAFRLDSLLWFPAGHAFVRRLTPNGLHRYERFALAPVPDVPLAQGDQVQIVDLQAHSVARAVYVAGQVPNPGRLDATLGLTVRDAILQAGGFLPGADPRYTRLEVGKDSGGAVVRLLHLDSALTTEDADLVLSDRSLLAIPRRLDREPMEEVVLGGEVLRPGVYALQRFDEPISSLIARAGGLQRTAFVEGGRLIRSDYGASGRVVVDFARLLRKPGSRYDLGLRAGDSLFFPRRPTTVTVVGRVNDPGLVTWQDGASWKDYVEMAGGFQDSANEAGVFVRQPDGRIQTRGLGIDDPLPGAQVVVPFRKPPEPVGVKDVFSGLNLILTTLVAGVTIYALLQK